MSEYPHDDSDFHVRYTALLQKAALRKKKPPSLLVFARRIQVGLLLGLLLSFRLSGGWAIVVSAHASAASFTQFASSPGTLTFQQFLQQGRADNAYHGPFGFSSLTNNEMKPVLKSAQAQRATSPLPSAEPPKMLLLSASLDASFAVSGTSLPASTVTPPTSPPQASPLATAPLVLKGSDNRLEVDVARGSLDFSKAALADGSRPVAPLSLQIKQISGHSIGSNNLLGTYLIHVVDSQGKAVQGIIVNTPITIRYHYQPQELTSLGLDPSAIYLNDPDLLRTAHLAKQSSAHLTVHFTNDSKDHILSAQTTILADSASTYRWPFNGRAPADCTRGFCRGQLGSAFL